MRRRLSLVGVGLAVLACQGPGVRSSEIPERAIALSYYDAETLRRRAEAITEGDAAAQPRSRLGVARIDEVTSYLGRLAGVRGDEQERVERRFPGRLALLDPRSEEVAELRAARPGAVARDWSPDGERLMFSQLAGEYRQLFELNRKTGEVGQLTRGRRVHPDGCYGPGGRFVFATAWVEGDRPVSVIELTEPGGLRPRRISEGPADHSPACAPDGSAIAWVAVDERGRDAIVVRMPPLGDTVRRIGPGRHPAFSPDGQWIVYSAPVKRRWRLYRIRPDGSGRAAVGRGTLDEIQPSFSPDGRLLVYVSDDGYRKRIYMRRFDGSGDRVLLRSGGGQDPVW